MLVDRYKAYTVRAACKDDSPPLVSIIIPVYNVVDYVEECVSSILAQTYKNIEMILVDDGSTDGSAEICDEYAKSDSRITVIHKENGGLSDARNVGLDHASGAYISFIDSDDVVSEIFIEALYSALVESGTLISAVPRGSEFLDGGSPNLRSLDVDDREQGVTVLDSCEYLKRMLYQEIATGAPWRLYAREVLGDDPFPVGYYYEDLGSTYRFIHRAGEVALLDDARLYGYRLRPSGIIGQEYKHIKAVSALYVTALISADISTWYPSLKNAVSSRCFSLNRMVYSQALMFVDPSDRTKEDEDMLWREIAKRRGVVLKDPEARKRERLAAACACVGRRPFSLFCRLCKRVGLIR